MCDYFACTWHESLICMFLSGRNQAGRHGQEDTLTHTCVCATIYANISLFARTFAQRHSSRTHVCADIVYVMSTGNEWSWTWVTIPPLLQTTNIRPSFLSSVPLHTHMYVCILRQLHTYVRCAIRECVVSPRCVNIHPLSGHCFSRFQNRHKSTGELEVTATDLTTGMQDSEIQVATNL